MRLDTFLKVLTFACLVAASHSSARADDLAPLTADINGDGVVKAISFGDSVTFGVGDGDITAESSVKGGYPDRAETLLGFPFDNAGVPGEELTDGGGERFLSLMLRSTDDYVLIFEGANDAYRGISSVAYRTAMQRAINAAGVLGKAPVVMTLPIPCCEHGAQVPATVRYISEIQSLALANDIPLVDIDRAWRTTCVDPGVCELYNLPEGLHPNAKGYDVIAQTVAARFLGIDIFSEGGAAALEQALGLPSGTVLVKPGVVAAAN